MSYTASLPNFEVSDHDNQLNPEKFSVSPPYDALHNEPKLQLESAVDCIERILDDGVLGPEGTRVNITISGHANPEYESHPENNPSPNNVTIHLVSVREVAEAEPGHEYDPTTPA